MPQAELLHVSLSDSPFPTEEPFLTEELLYLWQSHMKSYGTSVYPPIPNEELCHLLKSYMKNLCSPLKSDSTLSVPPPLQTNTELCFFLIPQSSLKSCRIPLSATLPLS